MPNPDRRAGAHLCIHATAPRLYEEDGAMIATGRIDQGLVVIFGIRRPSSFSPACSPVNTRRPLRQFCLLTLGESAPGGRTPSCAARPVDRIER